MFGLPNCVRLVTFRRSRRFQGQPFIEPETAENLGVPVECRADSLSGLRSLRNRRAERSNGREKGYVLRKAAPAPAPTRRIPLGTLCYSKRRDAFITHLS